MPEYSYDFPQTGAKVCPIWSIAKHQFFSINWINKFLQSNSQISSLNWQQWQWQQPYQTICQLPKTYLCDVRLAQLLVYGCRAQGNSGTPRLNQYAPLQMARVRWLSSGDLAWLKMYKSNERKGTRTNELTLIYMFSGAIFFSERKIKKVLERKWR